MQICLPSSAPMQPGKFHCFSKSLAMPFQLFPDGALRYSTLSTSHRAGQVSEMIFEIVLRPLLKAYDSDS